MQISALHPAKLISYFPVTSNCDLCPPSFLPAAATCLLRHLGGGQAWQLKKPDVRVYKESFQQWQLLVRSRSSEALCLALTVCLLVAMAGLPKSHKWGSSQWETQVSSPERQSPLICSSEKMFFLFSHVLRKSLCSVCIKLNY